MQKNILILGLGAFGFAIAKHLGENNPKTTIFASEINAEIFKNISETRKHPYFFEGVTLPTNIELISDANAELGNIDIIISIIPCQFVGGAFSGMKEYLKDGVTILNLSKGIDNQSLQTVSEKLSEVLDGINYNYAYLAGGMIAAELVEGKKLGADIVTQNNETGEILEKIFESESLQINLKIGSPKNTELYAALKNIIALILGYYEGTGAGASTLGYYFSTLLGEIKQIIKLLDGDSNLEFTDYALSGDLIATCFGASRNRLLGNMLGKGTSISEALSELKTQNKIAEGYETLKGVYTITKGKEGFEEINSFGSKYL
ncbi:hypothetical protein GW846_00460 [Candidatus Gracilibacteria bacterium]|nr:hypothetical protein [Candidatus Gracilibacteria bacterium]